MKGNPDCRWCHGAGEYLEQGDAHRSSGTVPCHHQADQTTRAVTTPEAVAVVRRELKRLNINDPDIVANAILAGLYGAGFNVWPDQSEKSAPMSFYIADDALPCPFCNGAAVGISGQKGSRVKCRRCDAGTKWYSSREKAKKHWRKRRGEQPTSGERIIQGMREVLDNVKQIRPLPPGDAGPLLDQMNAITRHQLNPLVHPLTCGHDSKHAPLFPIVEDGAVVLRCTDCGYGQTHIPEMLK